MKKLVIKGYLELPDECSLCEALVRAGIRFKQMGCHGTVLAEDWHGEIKVETESVLDS